MAKSREEVQDIALYHMEKLSRRVGSDRENRPLNLAEQLEKVEREKKQGAAGVEWYDWLEIVKRRMKENRVHVAEKAFTFVTQKYRTEMEKIKANGTVREAMIFVEDRAIEWMNI
jgi:hypothetical protein